MINIFKKNCQGNKLELYIRELDLSEKEYDDFRIRLNDSEWINIVNNLSEIYETSSVLFNNLETNKRHTAYGQVKLNGEWIDLQSATFALQSDELDVPYVGRPKGNGIGLRLEETPKITNYSIDTNVEINNELRGSNG